MNTMPTYFRLFFPLAVLVLAGIGFYGQTEIEREVNSLRSQESLSIGLGAGELSRNIDYLTPDLMLLAHHSSLITALDDPSPANIAHLTEDFVNISGAKRLYDQIRWIDESGMERVRVDYVQNRPIVVAADKLQDKSKRYFFADTFKLKAGEVFISPLDLNIEHNEIERPFKPMLRLATPVFDSQGKKRGIVILNFYGRILLDTFAGATANISDHAMVLNSEGYWLKSPKAEDEWGFMFKKSELSLVVRAPAAWSRIQATDSGQEMKADGLWTWNTVYPLLAGQLSSTGAAEAIVPSHASVESKQYQWKTVAHVSSPRLKAIRQAIWLKFAGVAAFLLCLVGVGSWKLASAWHDRKMAEELLCKTNAELLSAQRIAKVGSWTLDLATEHVTWTSELYQMFCLNPELPPPDYTSQQQLFTAESWEHLRANVARTCEDGIPYELEMEMVRADGIHGWILARGEAVRDSAGEVIGLHCVAMDITGLKKAEASLRQSEERWRSIVTNEPECVKLIDREGYLLEMNPAGLAMIQATPEQAIGQQVVGLVAEEDRTAFKDMIEAVFRGETKHLVFDMIGLQGRRLTLETTSVPLKDISLTGGVKALLGVTRDITERKRIEAALRASEEKFRTVADFTYDWEYWVGPDGNMLYCSPACLRVTGISAAEFIADPALIKTIVHPDDQKLVDQHLDSIPSPAIDRHESEFRIVDRSGEVHWISHACRRVCDSDGVYLGRRAANRDITERKQVEAEKAKLLAELQDALKKVKVLSGFLPICASCKKIRDDKGYWTQIESYISAHSEAQFSHGICQDCIKKLYPDLCDENGNITSC